MNTNQTQALMPAIKPYETNLPSLIKDALQGRNSQDERVSQVLAIITSVSGLVSHIKGVYSNNVVYPNLFLFIVAPPSSGKGKILDVRHYMESIHKAFLEKSKVENQHESLSTKNLDEKINQSKKPKPPKVVLIPGNITKSKLIDQLSVNGSDCPSVIFETEADTLTASIKNDHGDFSDVLRKGFHNEPIGYSRKLNYEFVEIAKPKFSVVLTGTPKQVYLLIPNAEDGLFSRFLFYNYGKRTAWQDVTPCEECNDPEEFIKYQQQRFHELWKFYSGRKIQFKLSANQWVRLNNFGYYSGEEQLKTLRSESDSIVKRHALMLYKVCMVLTAIRYFEKNEESEYLVCADMDFDIAIELIEKSMLCAQDLISDYPSGEKSGSQNRMLFFYNNLPAKFKIQDAVEKGIEIRIARRTVFRWLNALIDQGLLTRPKLEEYEKL